MRKLLATLLICVLCIPALSSCGSTKLSFDETTLDIKMYEEYDLTVTLKGAEAEDVVWSSSDTSIVTVRNGKITAVGTGNATVTATCGTAQDSCEVFVSGKISRALSVSKASVTLAVGGEDRVTATLKERGTPIENVQISWESAAPDIVSVDQNGNVKALKRGKAVVSAYAHYKGQDFVKDVLVYSTNVVGVETELSLQDTTATGSSLKELGAEKTEYGFSATEKAYRYQSGGGFSSRIFVDGAYNAENQPNYDKLVFKIRFTEQPTSGTTLYLANHKGVEGTPDLITANNTFVFYDAEGKVAKSFDANTTYTVVVNLRKVGKGRIDKGAMVYEYGFAFVDATTAYVGGAMLCSEDYYAQEYGRFEKVDDLPELTCILPESGSSLELGEEMVSGLDKYWVTASSSDPWSNRVSVGGVSASKYTNYKYMRIDVVFTSVAFRSIYVWNGGKPFKYFAQGLITPNKEEYTISGDDFTVFYNGKDVTGEPLSVGRKYTFRIRIYNINEAFGVAVSSSTADAVYVGNPLLINY